MGRPGIRTSKMVIDDALMKRSRTRSPELNNAVQFRARGISVHQVNVGSAGYIGDVSGVHVHAPPHQSIPYRGAQAFAFYVFDESTGRTLVEVVIVALLLEVAINSLGSCVCPVAQQHGVVAIICNGIFVPRLNDESAYQTYLLLRAAVTVIPICPVLHYGNSIDKSLARCNS